MKASQALENIICNILSRYVYQHQPTYHMHDKCVVEIFNVTDLECLRFRVCVLGAKKQSVSLDEKIGRLLPSSLTTIKREVFPLHFYVFFLSFLSKQLEKRRKISCQTIF